MKNYVKAVVVVFVGIGLVTVSQAGYTDTKDFTVKAVNADKTFQLSKSKEKYVALHFLLKTECPICLNYTQEYFHRASEVAGVEHIFLKPDEKEETLKWFSKFKSEDEKRPMIYQDKDAALAKQFKIPYGYEFHGETVHYPALIILDQEGNELFRYVGKKTQDRFGFDKFKEKMNELKARQ